MGGKGGGGGGYDYWGADTPSNYRPSNSVSAGEGTRREGPELRAPQSPEEQKLANKMVAGGWAVLGPGNPLTAPSSFKNAYNQLSYGPVGDALDTRINERQWDAMERRGANPKDYGMRGESWGSILGMDDDDDDLGGFGDLGGSSPGNVGPL